MKHWYDNWDAISPIFKFSKDVRMVIYTTNAIEKPELNVPVAEQSAQRIPQRHGAAESTLSGDI